MLGMQEYGIKCKRKDEWAVVYLSVGKCMNTGLYNWRQTELRVGPEWQVYSGHPPMNKQY
jgi:hypothetical protein